MNMIKDLQELIDEWTPDLRLKEEVLPPISLPADPVACACASYRVWKENPSRRWADIETVVVWQDDIEEAERLKKYYRDSMILQALKSSNGVNRSQFRQKLAKLVINELPITKKEIGLLCRLPYFYEEDQALDRIVAVTDDSKVQGTQCHAYSGVFTPLQKVLVSRSAGEYYHYWFTDTDNTPYNFVVKSDNPLITMFNGIYKQPTLKVNANLYPKTMRGHRGHNYYQLGSLELA